MIERQLTRTNHLIDPFLEIWEWQIPLYLFLGGLCAGLLILSSSLVLLKRDKEFPFTVKVGALLAPVFLSLGMLMLFLDLSHKLFVFRFYTTFQPMSAMSYGAWILVFIYPASLLYAASLWNAPSWLDRKVKPVHRFMGWAQNLRVPLAKINVMLGVGLGVYTGVFLSGLVTVRLWNSALMGPLFLISGLSSAAAFNLLFEKKSDSRLTLSWLDRFLIAAELVLIGLLVIDLLSGCGGTFCAANFLLYEDFSHYFWVFLVGLGMITPLALEALHHRTQRARIAWLAPVLVLGGGLTLRFLLVMVGQKVVCTLATM